MSLIFENGRVLKVAALLVITTYCGLVLLERPIPEELFWLIGVGIGYGTGESVPPPWLNKEQLQANGNRSPMTDGT